MLFEELGGILLRFAKSKIGRALCNFAGRWALLAWVATAAGAGSKPSPTQATDPLQDKKLQTAEETRYATAASA
jgi:hypothetical protein